MNKKILVLIAAIVIFAIVGISIYMFTRNSNDITNENNQANNVVQDDETDEEENNSNNNTTTDGSNVLVLYFSMSGNTEAVANFIHDEVGGDLIKLETVQAYPSDYDELVDYAQEEQQENARPKLSTTIENMDQYDIIFLGYPNWWGDMPMSIYTFLDTYDLSGKTIAPFITHGGSGLSGTPENIQNEEPNATVTDGLAIYGSSARDSKDDVLAWLQELGY